MSNEGERQSVIKTTKVRTALKGDNSWIQRRQQEQQEREDKEKPWIAEVRANRSNGVFEETSPVSTPTTEESLPTANTEKSTASSGYLIRGVFTKTDAKPTSTSSANGYAGVNSFTKKTSNTYKKIAPHTIRSSNETPVQSELTLDVDEIEKRTEAASSVLKGSAASRRSYVLSAAKKYDLPEKPNSSTQMSASFVATRVVISDDEDTATTDPVPSVPQQSVKSSSKEAPAPEVKDVKPVTETKSESTTLKTKVTVETKTAIETNPPVEPKPVPQTRTSLATKTTSETKPVDNTTSTTQTIKVTESKSTAEPKSVVETVTTQIKTTTETKPTLETKLVAENKTTTKTNTATESKSTAATKPVAEMKSTSQVKTVSKPQPEPTPEKSADSLTALSDTLISFGTEPARADTKPIHEKNSGVKNNDLLDLSESKPELDLLSRDLLTGDSSLPKTKQTQKSLDLLADDVIPIDTGANSISTSTYTRKNIKQTTDIESSLPKAKQTQKSLDLLADDVIPIDTGANSISTSTYTKKNIKQTTDIESSLPKAKQTQKSLDLLADDVIPIDTGANSISTSTYTKKNIKQTTDIESSLPKAKQTQKSLDLLADDVIPIDTGANSISTSTYTKKNIKQTTDIESSLPKAKQTQKSLDLLADDVIPIDTGANSISTSTYTKKNIKQTTDIESSLPKAKQTQKSLDLLADDVIPIDTGANSTSTSYTYTKKNIKQTTDIESSADPFDPITMPTKSREWYSKPASDSNSFTDTTNEYQSPIDVDPNTSTDVLVSLAEDVIPISTKRRNWSVNMESTTSTKTVDSAEQEKLPESESKKGFVYVKEYVNNSLHDGSSSEYVSSANSNYNYSSPGYYSSRETPCTYCGELVGDDKITIEHLKISCHPSCFKCGICRKPMGDLLYSMFLHSGIVHCESCYSNVL